MNILGDFINRVNALYPAEIDNEELNALLTTIRNQGDEIVYKDKEIARLHTLLAKYEDGSEKPAAKPAAKKAPAKKPATKTTAKKTSAAKTATAKKAATKTTSKK